MKSVHHHVLILGLAADCSHNTPKMLRENARRLLAVKQPYIGRWEPKLWGTDTKGVLYRGTS
jgi:hypothetical protein